MKLSSPPIKFPDYYGIDTPNVSELLAANNSIEEMRKIIGVKTLSFLSIDGVYKALGHEKRDNKNKRYLGKSVFSAVNLVNSKISKKLKGQNVHNQERIDALLINLDGTRQKTNLGANAMLAVSMAVKKLSAKVKKLPLYKTFSVKKNFQLPYPLMNIINGGAHANNGLRIQEFMIRPDRAKSFS